MTRRWDREGATDAIADTMIHAVIAKHEITLIVDGRPGAETAMIADTVRQHLVSASSMIADTFFEGLDAPSAWIEAA